MFLCSSIFKFHLSVVLTLTVHCSSESDIEDSERALQEEDDKEDFGSFGLATPSLSAASGFFKLVAPEAKDDDIETGHEREAPGAAPWRMDDHREPNPHGVSQVWSFMTVAVPELIDVGLAFEDEIAEPKHAQLIERNGLAPIYDTGSFGERRASLLELRTSVKSGKFQPIDVTWPYPGIRPTGLSCDVHGRHLLVTDGLSTFIAAVHEEVPAESKDAGMRLRHKAESLLSAKFQQAQSAGTRWDSNCQSFRLGYGWTWPQAAPCAALLGERLQALVLHQQGRRVASCHVEHGGSEEGGEGEEEEE
eukprot:Skav234420  [mRNA]  locus=scaffold4957:43804:53067:- [translate_table: standard]